MACGCLPLLSPVAGRSGSLVEAMSADQAPRALWRRVGRERVWRDRQKVQPQDRDSACLKGWVSVFTPLANRPVDGGRHEHPYVIDMNSETVLSHIKDHTASKGRNQHLYSFLPDSRVPHSQSRQWLMFYEFR